LAGHQEEKAFERRKLAILATRYRLARKAQCACIARECLRGVAEDVARKLVKKKNQRKPRARLALPFREPAIERKLDGIAETFADFGIERIAALEPAAKRRLQPGGVFTDAAEPETGHFRGRDHSTGLPSASMKRISPSFS